MPAQYPHFSLDARWSGARRAANGNAASPLFLDARANFSVGWSGARRVPTPLTMRAQTLMRVRVGRAGPSMTRQHPHFSLDARENFSAGWSGARRPTNDCAVSPLLLRCARRLFCALEWGREATNAYASSPTLPTLRAQISQQKHR